jgi:hypothetical protein
VPVALNWTLWEPSKTTVEFCGDMDKLIPPAVARMLIDAEADLELSCILVAVTVTTLALGRTVGAV